MGFQLTPESLRKLCRDLKLYSSCPELNDVLHLQCKGITKLENLDAYTGLKTLYLEQNAIADIENLDMLVNLRCLYLGKNMIHSTLGLQALTNLETLDLADNMISTITELSVLPQLKTLNISGNRLATVDDIRNLAGCTQLQSLDMASNRLEAPEVVDFVIGLPLLYLRLMGNPCVSNYRHYRKTLLARMPALNYLDESPVFPKDRRLAAAFIDGGGIEAERAMRETIRREEEETREMHRRAFDAMVERARQQPPEPHDPMRFRAVPPGESESDEEGLPALYRRRGKKKDQAAAGAGAADQGPDADSQGAAGAAAGQPEEPAAAPAEPDAPSSSAAEGATAQANGTAAEAGATAAATGSSMLSQPAPGSLIVKLENELREMVAVAGGPESSAAAAAAPADGGAAQSLLHASLARLHANVSNMASPTQLQALQELGHRELAGMAPPAAMPASQADFRDELRERAIARAAARAELASTMAAESESSALAAAAGSLGLEGSGGGAGAGARGAAHLPRGSRSVWRTPDYQRLWNMALQVGEVQEQQQAQGQEGAGSPVAAAGDAAAAGSSAGLLQYGAPQPAGAGPEAADVEPAAVAGQLTAEVLMGPGGGVPASATASVAPPTPDEAQSIADSAMGYDRVRLGSGGGGRERDLDLDSARERRVTDRDLRAVAEVDLDSARGGMARGSLVGGDIDSARSYSRPESSMGDPGDEGEAADVVEEEDVQLDMGGEEGGGSQQAAAARRSGEGDADLFARYTITTYGRGDTSHLRQRRNSGSAAASPSGAAAGAGRYNSTGGGLPHSPLRRGSNATASDAHPGSADVSGSGAAIHEEGEPSASSPTPAAMASAGGSSSAMHGRAGHAGHAPSHAHHPPHANPRIAAVSEGRAGSSSAQDHGELAVASREDSAHDPRASGSAGPAQATSGPARGRRSSMEMGHSNSLRRTDTAHGLHEGAGDGGGERTSAHSLGTGGGGHHSGTGQPGAHSYDSDNEMAAEVAAGTAAGAGDDPDDDVLEDPAELLQRARSILAAPEPDTAGTSASGPGGGLHSPADMYHQLAGQLQDPSTLLAARQAVLGPSSAAAFPRHGSSGPGGVARGPSSGQQPGVSGLYELD
ncbi:hypothetical protein HYH02_002393 [Chlamydomonas schloesseri]|uniref:Dynein assembly factor 1, axonemal homolog n=1 Tax=Chlamydomonas schloesseri TaxID=2026947 RepID=A0A835WV54_9CHLO|nr:hypothetical protein HYH02_002393 [Chlamydomonas schloesseri]|eukprot:KAG2453060.1 hypothetical protein HYH02_002393 [Chlamydomonas schloesseri]